MRIGRLDHPPLWREGRVGLELAGLLRSPVWHGEGVADGQGQPVMLVSGLLAGDDSLRWLAGWLKRTGHRPCRAGISVNVDCSGATVERLEQRLEQLYTESGQKVAIIGQSRGGSFARVLAKRHPEWVSGIVTLGSPLLSGIDVHPLLRAQIFAMGALGTIGAPGLFTRTCLWGDCCTSYWEDSTADFPAGVGFVSIYSRTDGVVRWRSCLDPAAELVEVRSSHCGMGLNAEVYRAIAASLEGLRAAEAAQRSRGRRSGRRRHLRLAA
jgi:pimeloyl-ACP methyl ester carboxylesterase